MLKKKYLFLVFLSIVIVYACRKEFSDPREMMGVDFDIEEAKAYLHEELQINSDNIVLKAPTALSSLSKTMALGNVEKKQVVGTAFWKKAKTYKMDDRDVVEVPFLSKNNYVSVYGFGLGDNLIPVEQQGKRADASYTSLLVYRGADRTTDKVFVTYIPDWEYLVRREFVMERITSNEIPQDFSGYIEYKNWDQDVLFVLRVDEGKAVKRHRLREDSGQLYNQKPSLRMDNDTKGISESTQATASCQTVCTPIYQTICVDEPEGPGGGGGGTVCTTKQVGENCQLVCDDGGDPTDPPNPGSGGDPTSPPSVTQDEVKVLINDAFEKCSGFGDNSEAYQQFEREMTELLNRGGTSCFVKYMLKYLKSSNGGQKIVLCMDEEATGGAYNAADKSMKFGSMQYVEKYTILHETIHAMQDKVYAGGIYQYKSSPGEPDIEFETALFVDLMKRVDSEVPTALYDDANQTYRSFLNGLLRDNDGNLNFYGARMFFADLNVNSNMAYRNFFAKFRERHPNYGDDSDVGGLAPRVIQHVLAHSNCFKTP